MSQIDVLIYSNGVVEKCNTEGVIFLSEQDPLLHAFSSENDFSDIVSQISELFLKKVVKIVYRFPQSFTCDKIIKYRAVKISNDLNVKQMFQRYQRWIERLDVIELFVFFEENNFQESNFEVGGSSNPNVIVPYVEERPNVDLNVTYEVGGSSNPNVEFSDEEEPDAENLDDDTDSERDIDLYEHNTSYDNQGDDEEGGEPYSPPEFMQNLDTDAFLVTDFPQFDNFSNYVVGGEFSIGMKFDGLDEVKHSVKAYSLKKNVDFKVVESTPKTYYCKCVGYAQGCGWLIRVSYFKRKDVWEVTRYVAPHTCVAPTLSQDHSKLDSDHIAREIELEIKADPSITVLAIQAKMRQIYGYMPSYDKAWAAKQKAIARGYGNWKDSYAQLLPWIIAVANFDPDSRVAVDTDPAYENGEINPNYAIFNRLFWTFGPMRKAFSFCKPLVEVDGTHMYGKYRQKLLVACSQDGNNNIVPIAFAVVDEESLYSWYFFLNNLRMHVVGAREIALISDRHQGIISAVNQLEGQWSAHHLFCIRHIAANFRREFKKKYLEKLVVSMGYSTNPAQFNRHYERLRRHGEQYIQWIDAIPREKWVCCFDNGSRYGHMTSNLVESVNNMFKVSRYLPVCVLLEATYFKMNKLFVAKRREANARRSAGHAFSNEITTKLQEMHQASRGLTVTIFSRSELKFHVREFSLSGSADFLVDLLKRYCDCGHFQKMHYPCPHAIASCSSARIDYKQYVDNVYCTEQVCRVYAAEFHVLPNKERWPPFNGPTLIPNPTLRRTERGRRRSTRYRNEMDSSDFRRPRLCTICRMPGHSRAQCPNRVL